jgi:uncharacterized membrane protein YfcA
MILLLTVLILLLIAIGAGFLGSLAGLGGGVVVVPILVIFFQVPFVDAVGASAISVLATSAATGSAYVKGHITDLRIGMFLEIATVPGALLGAFLTIFLARSHLEPVLLVSLGAILLFSAVSSLQSHRKEEEGTLTQDRLSRRWNLRGHYYDAHLHREVEYAGARTPPALGIMFAAGLVSGLFGIGSGVLKVQALERMLRLPIKVATATSNFMIGVTVAATTGVLLAAGYIDPVVAAPVALGTAAGSLIGSTVFPGLSNRVVQWVFLVILVSLSIELILRGMGFP